MLKMCSKTPVVPLYKNKKFWCIVFISIFILLLIFTLTLLIRAWLVQEPEILKCLSNGTKLSLTNDTIDRFMSGINYKTISLSELREVDSFIAFIEKSYPNIHSSNLVKREIINNHSLLYEIKGEDASLLPYLLLGHLDVVPVTAEKWDYEPFNASIHYGYIYGRGTLDAKCIVMGILEALENHLKDSFVPQRGFFVAFGHDEEVMGFQGARKIGEELLKRNIKFEFILDEGSFVIPDLLPGIKDGPVAYVSITEKGYLTLNLSVTSPPGHSSMPPEEPASVILSTALSTLQGNSHPNLFGSGPEKMMFEKLAPYVTFGYKIIFANLWFFSDLFGRILSKMPRGNALCRTTTAVTIIQSGIQENVLPSYAWAIVNHRVHPSITNAEARKYTEDLVNDDRVKISVVKSFESPKVSSGDNSYGYEVIRRAVTDVYPDSFLIPTVLIANTDSKWFVSMSRNIYRFNPAFTYAKDLQTIHGNNERISKDGYENVINFYLNLFIRADKKDLRC